MAGPRGADLAEEIWDIIKVYVMTVDQPEIARAICNAFETRGCDTICEAGELFKIAYTLDDNKAIELIGATVSGDIELSSEQLNSVLNWLGDLPDRL